MGPDFKLETEHLPDIFPDATLNVFSTCEDIRLGEFAEYKGISIVEYVSRILSLFKDLPEIKERTNEILLYLDLQFPNLSIEVSKHYRLGLKNFQEFKDAESRAEIIQCFDKYFQCVNRTVLPAITSLYNRIVYIKRVLAKTKDENGIPPEIHNQMLNAINFLYWRICPDFSFWKERVKSGNSCKTEEDKLKLMEWLLD